MTIPRASHIESSARLLVAAQLSDLLQRGSRAHLIGIGGVSMSPLAEELHRHGLRVTGSDLRNSPAVEKLRSLGIDIYIGHDAENVHGADLVIRTAAAREGNPEIDETLRLGIPLFERAAAWGVIMRGYANAVCVSGSHGKTTTTSMISQILLAAGRDPTVMIGGTLPTLGSGYRVGSGDTIVLESCEYFDSFLSFFPTLAVILNVDADHLDYFGDIDHVKAAFREFAELAPETGRVIACGDDRNTIDALRGLDRDITTFGFHAQCDVRCESVLETGHCSEFDVVYEDRVYCRVKLKVPGKHNILNALAACAAAISLGVPSETIEDALRTFVGADRRFEFKGRLNGAVIYDDYAHHPTELRALLDMATALPYKRVVVAFQPHTYSRTASHLEAFAKELRRADKCYIAEIYAAREINTYGITSADLAALVPDSTVCATLSDVEAALKAEARDGDLIITVGAGELDKVGEQIVN
ncbi:MAG: UDP-N-acetylmuramate--L-alanine ligase [Oscillospiraceae bacterium]|jgi:UDP-N-acetylmuramate--alanine ligase|nr:UDP-N-acetylmuramate--L-alanine ligase [Oscillospiraceae bacterium]